MEIRKKMNKIIDFLDDNETVLRVIAGFVGMILFLLIFQVIPGVYYSYFDSTIYFEVHSTTFTKSEPIYEACEVQQVVFERTSLVDVPVSGIRELAQLVEVNSDEVEFEVYREELVAALDEGRKKIGSEIKIPCTISEGVYVWKFNNEFNVRGISKTYSWTSPKFAVVAPTK